MKTVIRICGVILVAACFLTMLFGCSTKSEAVGSWSAFSVTNVYPDRLESYHFHVSLQDDGTMMVRGYCYDEETEYRFNEDIPLSDEAAKQIREIGIEGLMTKAKKKSLFDRQIVDTDSRTAYVTDQNGNEREVHMPDEMREILAALLRTEMQSQTVTSNEET